MTLNIYYGVAYSWTDGLRLEETAEIQIRISRSKIHCTNLSFWPLPSSLAMKLSFLSNWRNYFLYSQVIMATARGKQSTLYPEKETRRRSKHFFNRMKVRARYIDSLCSSFTDLYPFRCSVDTWNKALYEKAIIRCPNKTQTYHFNRKGNTSIGKDSFRALQ